MADAAAAREARRKAILSRGNDRLNKLASSARGEDYVANISKPEQPSGRLAPTTDAFLGEESVMPSPAGRSSPAPAKNPSASSNDGPNAWTTEQQQEFIRALMAAPENVSNPSSARKKEPLVNQTGGLSEDMNGDLMSTMLSALSQMPGQGTPSGLESMMGMPPMVDTQAKAVTNRSIFIRLQPIIHLIVTWALLGFFALTMEPKAYAEQSSNISSTTIYGTLERWAQLARRVPKGSFAVQAVPFFWAFTTLQLIMHSAEILTKSNPIKPPALLALAMPHLPPQFRSVIKNVLSYLRMGSMLLDDIAGLVVGIGVLVWISTIIVGLN